MNFSELEQLMSSRGVTSLADIARALKTTPQAVSNWKARDQVPFHIVSKINESINKDSNQKSFTDIAKNNDNRPYISIGNTITISDLFLALAQQLKIILITTFILVFLTFTYVLNIQESKFASSATVMFPERNTNDNMGISGLASQFGLTMPSAGSGVDLSSTSIFPELIQSRLFLSRVLDEKFYTNEFGKKLTLLSILNKGEEIPPSGKEYAITQTMGALQGMINLESDLKSAFSIITVTASEGLLAKELVNVILLELESLNRFFKKQIVNQKIDFIQSRISSVEQDLIKSEENLKLFHEKNRQISSPDLQLQLDRFMREVETQKGVYLTLKQQHELAKIEEVQEISILQVLDEPQIPIGPYNKNWKISVIMAGILGLGLGIILGFLRTYVNNPDIGERKKIRRTKNFAKKKAKDFIMDRRATGIISGLLTLGLPFYLSHTSIDPVYFGLYSTKFMIINAIYIVALLFFSFMFVYSTIKK